MKNILFIYRLKIDQIHLSISLIWTKMSQKALCFHWFEGDVLNELSMYPQTTHISINVCDTITDYHLSRFADFPNITRVSLRCCTNITSNGISYLAKNTKLTHLDINSILLNDFTLLDIAKNRTLTSFSCFFGGVTDQGAQILSNNTTLLELELYGNSNITDTGLRSISQMTQLVSLNIGKSSITDPYPLSQITNLTKLQLCKNHIVDFTGSFPSLSRLDISDNIITQWNPECYTPNLITLKISCNDLTSYGIKALARSDKNMIRELDISFNRNINDAAVPALLNIPTLKELNIGSTQIDYTGASLIIRSDNLSFYYMEGCPNICQTIPYKMKRKNESTFYKHFYSWNIGLEWQTGTINICKNGGSRIINYDNN